MKKNENNSAPSMGILRSSMLYAIGDLVTKGARIVLVPFYVAVLSQSELGQMALLTAIGIAAWTLCTFGLNFAVQRQYFDYGDQGDQFVTSIWFGRLAGGLPVFAGLMMLAVWYEQQAVPLLLILCVIASGYLRGGLSVIEAWYIATEQPVRYRIFTFLQFLTSTSLIVFAVVALQMGVAGAVYAELLAYGIWTFIGGGLLLRSALPSVRAVRWKAVLAYCLPAIPHAFFMWGLSGLDRLLLQQGSVPLDQIGIYDVAYLLASFLSIVTMALRSAWLPKYFKQVASGSAEGHLNYGKTATIFFNVVFLAAMCGFLFAPEAVGIVVPGNSEQHIELFRIVLLGFLGMAFFIAFNQPLLSERKIGIIACISATGLTVNVVANEWLIPQWGVYGAAIATVSAYAVMSTVMLIVVNRMYAIQWEYRRTLVSTALLIVALLSGWWLGSQAWGWDLALRLLLASAFAAYVAMQFPMLQAKVRKRLGTERLGTKTEAAATQSSKSMTRIAF